MTDSLHEVKPVTSLLQVYM